MSNEQHEDESEKLRLLTSLRYRIEYAALRTIVWGFRALGIDRASQINGKLWQIVAPRTRRHKSALLHLSWAFPEKSSTERDAIARASWNNLGRTAAEACVLDTIAAEPSRVKIATPDILTRVANEFDGRAVVAPMHSGNWEVLAPALTNLGLSGALIYQRLKNPYAERFLRETRLKYCAGGMFPKHDQAVRRLMGALRAGHGVVILADQRVKGLLPKFFGYSAPTTPLPAYLARTFEVPLLACRVVRTNGANFELEVQEVPVPRDGDRDADIFEATQALQGVFENWIRQYPEQWMWAHRRWRHRGLPRDYPSAT